MIFILIVILCTNYLVKSKNVLLIIADDAGLEVNCKKFHEKVVHYSILETICILFLSVNKIFKPDMKSSEFCFVYYPIQKSEFGP